MPGKYLKIYRKMTPSSSSDKSIEMKDPADMRYYIVKDYIEADAIGTHQLGKDEKSETVTLTRPDYLFQKLGLKLSAIEGKTRLLDQVSELLDKVYITSSNTTEKNEAAATKHSIDLMLQMYKDLLNISVDKSFFAPDYAKDESTKRLAAFFHETLHYPLPDKYSKDLERISADDIMQKAFPAAKRSGPA